MQQNWLWSLGQEDTLEKETAADSRIIAWEIPWAEESGGLQSMVLQRVEKDWVTNTFNFHCINCLVIVVQSLSPVQFFLNPGTALARLLSPSPSPGACSNSLSWWRHPTVSSSVVLFSSCPQSFPASGSFPMSQLFTSGGQSIGASASASVLPINIQDWFSLGFTGLNSL